MTPSSEQLSAALRAALKEEERLRERNRQLQDVVDEPIAIVGMACRYPGGVASPRDLWRLVASGADAISPFPGDRGWDLERIYDPDPERPGRTSTREGGFLADAAGFDAEFFSISPRDARGLDPQLRLLLEASWEAAEDAGIDPLNLAGSQSGVFAGVMYHDYGWGESPTSEAGGTLATGGSASVASGHVAYSLGLEGPAITVDTACSSSLVSLHLACQSLRRRECGLALAGGVTVLAMPGIFIQFSRQGGVAPDGRCKSFAEGANGAGFSEGVGVLALERLSDAQRHGRDVLAVVRGSAVNQDGASNGLTAPNGPSQERVIRQALSESGLRAADVDAIEAHGTGTPLGDPIEANALLATYGQEREQPLWLGSLKSNIGHSQAAAGVGGVIKSVMAIREGMLPKTLHVEQPSSRIDWSAGRVELLREAVAWDSGGGPRRIGVSSFGATGTNAHLILEQAPMPAPAGESALEPGPEPPLGDGLVPLVLSAKSEPALREGAARLAARMRTSEADPAEVGRTLLVRPGFERRGVVVGAEREQLLAGLDALSRGERAEGVAAGRAPAGAQVAFVFSGHGSQWEGMGRGLLATSPVFAAKVEACAEALAPHMDWSVEDVLRGVPGAPALEAVDVVQPLIFTVAVSLAELWRSLGVEPAFVVGHSQGEAAAAHVAGGLSLEDAARITARRSQLIAGLSGRGGLVSIALAGERLDDYLERWGGRIEVAAHNGPSSAVLTGDREALDELLARSGGDGVRARDIPGAVAAAHSPQIEALREDLLEALAPVSPRAGSVPLLSTVSGEPIDTALLDAAYWYRNTRQPVLFEQASRRLVEEGIDALIEISAHPVLATALEETVAGAAPDPDAVAVLGTLRRGEGGPERFAASLAEASAAGAEVDWSAFFAGGARRSLPLPTYPFQRRRYWLEGGAAADPSALGQAPAEHPLLAAEVDGPEEGGLILTGRVSLQSHPWLADHAAFGSVLFPGAAMLELALHAGDRLGAPLLEEMTVEAPLALPEEDAVQLRVSVGPEEEGRRELSIHSRADAGGEWVRHARGTLSAKAEPAAPPPPESWPPPGSEPLAVSELYERLAASGVEYGPAFRGLRAAWRRGEETFAEVVLPAERTAEAGAFGLHPALLDATGHAGVRAALDEDDSGALPLPFAWRGVRLSSRGASALRVHIVAGAEGVAVSASDEAGAPVIAAEAVVSRPISQAQLQAAIGRQPLYVVSWQPPRLSAPSGAESVEPVIADFRGGDGEGAVGLASAALERLREHLGSGGEAGARLVVLTEGALAAGDERLANPAAAAVCGLVRCARAEHPGSFSLIDLDGSEASDRALPDAIAASAGEPELALREGELLCPRLALAPDSEGEEPAGFDPDSTVLITGGTGGIGAAVARHLATVHGVRHLLLVSRSGEGAPGAAELRAQLEELGAEVRIAARDVADRAELEQLLSQVPPEQPLGAVIHCAAVLDDGMLDSLDGERLERVMAPKAIAAWHLHELTRELDLTHFICFSSVVGLLGGPGQGNYAAANAFLDALARQRRGEGLAGSSLAWGGWELPSGMAAALGEEERNRLGRLAGARLGLAVMPTSLGLSLFDAALGRDEPLLVPAQLDLVALRGQAASGSLPALMRGLVRAPAGAAGEGGSLARRLAAAPEAEREAVALELVREHAAAVLGHDSPADVDTSRAFKDLGFDSLAAIELRNRLSSAAAMRLEPTLVFDYPTPARLASFLAATARGERSTVAPLAPRTASEEPIAIVGMACRFPGGVASPRDLWDLLSGGVDAISPFPADRGWDLERLYDPDPGAPGRTYAREGGFLEDGPGFDPDFFGISPREAREMDPQQRQLLEVAWEALEGAAIVPAELRGSPTGVFAGAMYQDYDQLAGMTSAAVSGRIAYTLGLEGPTMTVDTACSSSLVALHLACQALRAGECEMALAGGVSVLSTPGVLIEFSRQRGLAPDGRCKSFAEAADGAGVAEGVGVLALERLSEAQRKGREVLATIRGSAVNQDGASNGLTAPNGPAQERVIRRALAAARLEPAEIDAVEAHGTGTPLGDPIEAGALLATYGQDRERPLRLGSIKSNIGHTQAAAGVAGVIKMTLAMREGLLPATLHAEAPSTKVDWEAGEIELLREPSPWRPEGRPRRAAISSFGATGTNAHLILEEPPSPPGGEEEEEGTSIPDPGLLPLLLSAKDEGALRESAGRLASHLEANPELGLGAIAGSLVGTRSLFERRAAVLGEDRDSAISGLGALARGEPAAGLIGPRRAGGALACLFSGQGSQRLGMGAQLHASNPTFAAAFDAVCEQLDPHLESPLASVVFASGEEAAKRLEDTTYAQPALFAIEVALFRLLGSLGLAPALLGGHSIGEIAAAHVAGVFDLADAAKLVAARGALMGELPPGGAMLAVEAAEQEAGEALAGQEEELAIAAVNGPLACVLSGTEAAIEAAREHWREQGRKTKRLAVSHAFHSPLMEPMLAGFEAVARGISYSPPRIPLLSNLSGELMSPEQACDPLYWVAHVRQPVRFAAGLATLLGEGASCLLEVGPDAALSAMAAQAAAELSDGEAPAPLIAPLLRAGRPESESLITALAHAHSAGAGVDWGAILPRGAEPAPLPTYPFQRRRYWLEAPPGGGDVIAVGQAAAGHPLLGATIALAAGGGTLMTGSLSLRSHPWLGDHRLAGTAVLPGTALLELALRAAAESGELALEELAMQAPLVLPEQGSVQVQVSVSPADGEGRRGVEIHSRREDEDGGEWTANAQGTLAPASRGPDPELARFAAAAWPPEGAEPLAVDDLYERLGDLGFEFGAAFRCARRAWRRGEDLFAELSLAEEEAAEAGRFALHPALLDSAGHVAVGLELTAGERAEELPLPFAWRGVSTAAHGASSLRVQLGAGEDGGLLALDGEGAPVAKIESVAVRHVGRAQLRAAAGERSLYRLRWGAPAGDAGTVEPGEVEIADLRPAGGDGEPASGLVAVALERLQSFLAAPGSESRRLALLTRDAVAASPGERPDPRAAAIWGLVRSAQSEHPGRFVLIDDDPATASEQALAGALVLSGDEPQLALREGRLLVPRFERAPAPGPGDGAGLDPERTVLITGGLGGLGALIARHLVAEHGARHLLLASRSGPEAPGAPELTAALEELGATVRVASCDVSSRSDLQALLTSIPAAHPLGAVIHSAALLDDGVLESQDGERLARVMAPKADAAWHLHELTAELDLTHFVLFSSAAGLLGNPGQAGYAAANAFLDALAERRHAEGLPALSIAWGALDVGTTMLGDEEAARVAALVRRRLGVVSIDRQRAAGLFDAALSGDAPLLAAVDFDSAALRESLAVGGLAPLQRGLVQVPARHQRQRSLAERLSGVAAEEREGAVLDLVREHVAAVLGHTSADAVDPERPFNDLGFDSLAAVELRNRLGAATGLRLRPTLVFDYPSVTSLARYLLAEAMPDGAAGEAGAGPEELAFRQALARVPLARLREAGLIEDLVEVVGVGEALAASPSGEVSIEQIDELDADELIERTLAQVADAEGESGE